MSAAEYYEFVRRFEAIERRQDEQDARIERLMAALKEKEAAKPRK